MDEEPPPILQLLFQLRDRLLRREKPASPELQMLQEVIASPFARDTLPAIVGQRPEMSASDRLSLILEPSRRLGKVKAGQASRSGKEVTLFAPGSHGTGNFERGVAEGVLSHEYGHVLDATTGGEAILGRKAKPEEFAELFSEAMSEVRTASLWAALASDDPKAHWKALNAREKEKPGLIAMIDFILANPIYADNPLRKSRTSMPRIDAPLPTPAVRDAVRVRINRP